jgi:hypothetical protein
MLIIVVHHFSGRRDVNANRTMRQFTSDVIVPVDRKQMG